MLKTKKYPVQADIIQLQNSLRELLEDQKFKLDIKSEPLSLTIHAQKKLLNLPSWTGSTSDITIKIGFLESSTDVSVYDQIAERLTLALVEFVISSLGGAMTGGLLCFVFIPMFVPLYAAYHQKTITKQVWDGIESHIAQLSYGEVS